MSELEKALSMLTVAKDDLRAIKGMKNTRTFTDRIFGFHAQQAIEKTLKAWIAVLEIEYPWTHDISRLLAILEIHGRDVERFWDLVRYNAFAVQFRYEAFDSVESLNRPAAIAKVQILWDHVNNIIKTKETAG